MPKNLGETLIVQLTLLTFFKSNLIPFRLDNFSKFKKEIDVKMQEIIITKASGETAVFSMDKLRQSMRNSGASEQQIESVVKNIEPRLYQGVSTKKIYRWAFNMLKQGSSHIAARYHLKSAIMELGPSGFPFEEFVGEIFKRQGYQIKVGVTIEGKCVSHEVDVLVSSEKEHRMVECKFHSQPGKVSDVKVPLYIQSRFQDIYWQWIQQPKLKDKRMEGWVVTNTRFSDDATQYGKCSGLHLLGWDYPIGQGLKNLIDEFHLYPITCLTTLTKREKEQLLEANIILVSELISKTIYLNNLGISDKRLSLVIDEVNKMLVGTTDFGKL